MCHSALSTLEKIHGFVEIRCLVKRLHLCGLSNSLSMFSYWCVTVCCLLNLFNIIKIQEIEFQKDKNIQNSLPPSLKEP